jgi:hypothetical protein
MFSLIVKVAARFFIHFGSVFTLFLFPCSLAESCALYR